jgi:hypothetical protein
MMMTIVPERREKAVIPSRSTDVLEVTCLDPFG